VKIFFALGNKLPYKSNKLGRLLYILYGIRIAFIQNLKYRYVMASKIDTGNTILLSSTVAPITDPDTSIVGSKVMAGYRAGS